MTDSQSDRTEGYHLFLEPSGATAESLKASIAALAEEFGGPTFPPHVTLLSGIATEEEEVLIEKTEQLAALTVPFSLTLGEAGTEDAYFRALYLKVQESEALVLFHAHASELFSMQDASTFMPHLSLLYGNYPEERKRAALAALLVPEGSFSIDRISLYRTEGTVADWQKVADLSLGTY
ncbi:MAG: cyclic phosphodiesterase-like protein [Parcubacteria group bacterium]|nr:cyclic phosphodiesterase-like protein [Parcubacteria group bacterium]